MNKNAVINITDAIGSREICDLLGVSMHAVRHARTSGAFSASWYDALHVVCEEIGIPCPRTAFNWRPIAKKYGNDIPSLQANSVKNAELVGNCLARKPLRKPAAR